MFGGSRKENGKQRENVRESTNVNVHVKNNASVKETKNVNVNTNIVQVIQRNHGSLIITRQQPPPLRQWHHEDHTDHQCITPNQNTHTNIHITPTINRLRVTQGTVHFIILSFFVSLFHINVYQIDSYDAITMIRGEIFVFKDQYLWRVGPEGKVMDGYPHEIRRLWNKLPANLTHVDAVYENKDRKIIFFIGKSISSV